MPAGKMKLGTAINWQPKTIKVVTVGQTNHRRILNESIQEELGFQLNEMKARLISTQNTDWGLVVKLERENVIITLSEHRTEF